jgi:hypothetical protein
LRGLSVVAATKARNSYWRTLIEDWAVPPGVSPRIGASLQRERQSNAAPLPVWEMDWQDCPVAFRLRGLARRVVSVKVPLVFPPGDMPVLGLSPWQHWFIMHREDATKVLLLKQQCKVRLNATSKLGTAGLGCKHGMTGTQLCRKRPADSSRRSAESVILGRGTWRTRCAYGGSQWPRMPIMKGEKLTFP